MKKLSLTEATCKALEGKLVEKKVKKTEGKKGYEQGICPKCGADIISYDPVEWYDDSIGYPFTCSQCGASGQEYYNLVFDEIELNDEN